MDEARSIIARLLDRGEDDSAVNGQLNEILEAIEVEQADGEPTWREVFSNQNNTRNLHRVLLGMGPYMFNQWSVFPTSVVLATQGCSSLMEPVQVRYQ